MGMATVQFITSRASRHAEPIVHLLESRSIMLAAEDAILSDDEADRLHGVVKVVEAQIIGVDVTTTAGALAALRAVREETEASDFASSLLDTIERFLELEA